MEKKREIERKCEREREREKEREWKNCRRNGAFTHGIHSINAVLVAEYYPPVSSFYLLPFFHPPVEKKQEETARV